MINTAAAVASATAAVASASATASDPVHNPSTADNLQVSVLPSNSIPPPNPRKKRTKLIRIQNPNAAIVKPKPDPAAPKITRPCSECGKKFWSWKALFGHMRCHPERQWRGINPPPNFRNRLPEEKTIHYLPYESSAAAAAARVTMTEDDHEVAACLLMLSNSDPTPTAAYFCSSRVPMITFGEDSGEFRSTAAENVGILHSDGDHHNCRFECSCCRKVFTSHQALGGHRASHRNVKGCFAITSTSKNDGETDGDFNDEYNSAVLMELRSDGDNRNALIDRYSHLQQQDHKCGICSRVFSSGQALGGHKRCHWEKTNIDVHQQAVTSSSLILSPPVPLTVAISSSYQQQEDLKSNPVTTTLESSSSVCEDCHGFLSSGPNSSYYNTNCSVLPSSPGLDLRLGL